MPSTGTHRVMTVSDAETLPAQNSLPDAAESTWRGRATSRVRHFFASTLGLWVGMALFVLVPMVSVGWAAWSVTDPPLQLGQATVFTSQVNGAAMVEFPDGQVAPASVVNVQEGDTVTVFLNGSTVTNNPVFPAEVALWWGLAAAATIGLAAGFMFAIWHAFTSALDRRNW